MEKLIELAKGRKMEKILREEKEIKLLAYPYIIYC